MKMTRDFEHEKEVQKNKKMAFLRNEEYKETDQEDLSDSDEREMFEINEEENNKAKNLNKNSRKQKNKNPNFLMVNNNVYFKHDQSRLNTDGNSNHSKASINNYNNNSKGKLNKSLNFSDSEHSEGKNKEKEKTLKKPGFKLPIDDANFEIEIEDKLQDYGDFIRENISMSGKKRNNLEIRKETNSTNNNFDKNINKECKGRESKITNCSNNIIKNKNINYENCNKNNNNNLQQTKNLIIEENCSKKLQKGIIKEESSQSLLDKKIKFIKNLPLEKLQDLINSKKKKLEDQMFEGIKLHSEIKADQILQISLNDYSDLYQDLSMENNNVHIGNLKRVIRVRNILKGKHKEDKQKNRKKSEIENENEDEFNKIIRFKKLGPPSFLKTNFKKETNTKFKMLSGKFFGCQV